MYKILLFTVLLTGCKQGLTPQQFVDYVNNPQNGFITEKKYKNHVFTLQYIPSEYITLQFVFSGLEQDFDKLKVQSDSALHFKLTICNNDSLPQDLNSKEYQDKITFLNSRFVENCFLLTTENDTIHPVIHHFEKGFNIKPCVNVVFAFDNYQKVIPHKLLINAPLYTSSPLEFDIKKIYKLSIPNIKI